MKLETFRAANALEIEITELKKAKENAAAGIYLTGGFNLARLLGDLAATLINSVVEGITGLINQKEAELKELLEENTPPNT